MLLNRTTSGGERLGDKQAETDEILERNRLVNRVLRFVPTADAISANVCNVPQNKQSRPLRRRSRPPRLSLSFFTLLFTRLNEKTSNNKSDGSDSQNDSHPDRKPLKKITCQADGENSRPDIQDRFGNELSARFVNHSPSISYFTHTHNFVNRTCQPKVNINRTTSHRERYSGPTKLDQKLTPVKI